MRTRAPADALALLATVLAATLALGVALGPAPAAAGPFWGATRRAPSARDRAVADGDAALTLARVLFNQDDRHGAADAGVRALGAYERALAAGPSTVEGPDDAELHYRAFLAAAFYLPPDLLEAKARAIVRHVDGLRAADPLDPRSADVLIEVCHALAKLGARGGPDATALFERTVREYEVWFALVDEADARMAPELATNEANLAEILMAIGRMEEAIAHYRRALDLGASSTPALPWYGLAVALDRDGQGGQARSAMRAALALDPTIALLEDADEPSSSVYFVPMGDKWYYLGLAAEVRGRRAEARDYFMTYLREVQGARPEHLDAARRHLRETGGTHGGGRR